MKEQKDDIDFVGLVSFNPDTDIHIIAMKHKYSCREQ